MIGTYLRNKDKKISWVRSRNKRLAEERTKLIIEAKSRPCADCGIQYPHYVMDLDHLRDKKFAISRANTIKVSISKLIEEILKCEVVCSNCHRLRTWNRAGLMLVD